MTGVPAWWVGLADFGHEGEWVWQVRVIFAQEQLSFVNFLQFDREDAIISTFGTPAAPTRRSTTQETVWLLCPKLPGREKSLELFSETSSVIQAFKPLPLV